MATEDTPDQNADSASSSNRLTWGCLGVGVGGICVLHDATAALLSRSPFGLGFWLVALVGTVLMCAGGVAMRDVLSAKTRWVTPGILAFCVCLLVYGWFLGAVIRDHVSGPQPWPSPGMPQGLLRALVRGSVVLFELTAMAVALVLMATHTACSLAALVEDVRRLAQTWMGLAVLKFAGVYAFVLVLFAMLFRAVANSDPAAFNVSGPVPRVLDWLYFSAITLATVGYGDIAPRSTVARCLVMSEVLLGALGLLTYLSWLLAVTPNRSFIPEDGAAGVATLAEPGAGGLGGSGSCRSSRFDAD